MDHDLEVLPVMNKIDLPSADPDAVVKQEIEDVIGLPCDGRAARFRPRTGHQHSGRAGDVWSATCPRPTGDPDAPLQSTDLRLPCMTATRGVIVYVRVMDGTVKPGDTIRLMSTGAESTSVVEVGCMRATRA